MKNLREEVIAEVVRYMEENKMEANTENFEAAFEKVMEKRLSFYDAYFNNLEENVEKMDNYLQK